MEPKVDDQIKEACAPLEERIAELEADNRILRRNFGRFELKVEQLQDIVLGFVKERLES